MSSRLTRRELIVGGGRIIAGAGLVGPFLAACGSSSSSGGGTQTTQLNLSLDFVAQVQHAPIYLALSKGFYAQQNLAVTVFPTNGSADSITRVAAKKVDFGIANMGILMSAIASQNVPVKSIAAIYGAPADSVLVNAKHGINSPVDLQGKTVSDSAASATRLLWPAFAQSYGMDFSKINFVIVSAAATKTEFIAGRVDAVDNSVFGDILVKGQVAGNSAIQPVSFPFAAKLQFYAQGLMANTDTLKSNPDLVRRFVAATLKGYEYALANPDEAANTFQIYIQNQTTDQTKEAMGVLSGLFKTPEAQTHGSGYMDATKMDQTIDLLTKTLSLPRRIASSDLYTNSYLPSH